MGNSRPRLAVDYQQRPCFLAVESSVTGKRWESRSSEERKVLRISQQYSLPEIVARVIVGRNVAFDDVEAYLCPSLKSLLPDPSRFRDMDEAVEECFHALRQGKKIAVFGDYDVDGATSVALLVRYFRALGQSLEVHIPDRIKEGYGPNSRALEGLVAKGCGLIITVDCGTAAHEVLADISAGGTSVVVLDHHEAGPALPAVKALVNPNRRDEDRHYGNLAACGVVFLFLVGLNRKLREEGYFQGPVIEPNLMGFLDLVALGTVCDVVPLTGLNRALVLQGLKVFARRQNAGLVALCDVARLQEKTNAEHLGFFLGPRVNAGGRVGEAALGTRLLCCDDPQAAAAMSQSLNRFNQERKALEEGVLAHALVIAEEKGPPQGCVIVAGRGWHQGVIGIVASRLKDRYNLPALVITFDEQGLGKGSGRSVAGLDLGAVVIAAVQQGLLEAGGGHKMAAGLTIHQENLAPFVAFVQERVTARLKKIDYQPVLGLDGALASSGVSVDLIDLLESCGPFGTGNPQPRFVLANVRLVKPSVVGEKHVRVILSAQDGSTIKAVAFQAFHTDIGGFMLSRGSLPVHVAGKIKRDTWSGQDGVQLIIDDIAAVDH